MAAFAHAVHDLRYDHVETDVHATADGILIAFHDETLDRVTDRTGRVGDLPWSQVRSARIAGREPIPLLAEVLDAFPDVRVVIDPKSDEAVAPLAACIAGVLGRVCVGSFSDQRLARLRARFGRALCTSAGPREVVALRLASWGVPLWVGAAQCVQVPVRSGAVPVVDARFVAAAHRRRLPVHVWTVDDPVEQQRLIDLGVDGIVTDDVAGLRAVLDRRGTRT